MKAYSIKFQPGGKSIIAVQGSTLMEAMNRADTGVDFPCGGHGKCGKCRVKVVGDLGEPTGAELERLTEQELAEGIRLACETIINGDMVIEISEHRKLEHHILVNSGNRPFAIEPHLKKLAGEVHQPTLRDHQADWQRLKATLTGEDYRTGTEELKASLTLLRQLPAALRQAQNQVTAIVYGSTVLGVEPGNTAGTMLGMAFDIGTTTIVGYLLDLYSGEELEVVSTLNPQAKYGADVISRITFAGSRQENLEQLHFAVKEALNGLIREATFKAGKNLQDVYGISIAANTTMHHLFLGINPRSIAVSPYISVVNEGLVLDAGELGLTINQAGKVFVLPNIAGFVGADTTAVLLATDLSRSEEVKLILDIGTNGEIVLGSRNKLVACSAAAGPAFEGAQISSGMRGAVGAIDHITFHAGLQYSVLGGARPVGICGSALLDGVAGLVELGMLDKRGRFVRPEQLKNPAALALKNRLIEHDGTGAFLLAGAEETGHGRPIVITQQDIRELQLAKGAIAAGIRILMETCGVQMDEIKEVLLAGAFGNYLSPHSACVIGLIPRELEDRIRMVGNAAGTGARLALLSAEEFARAGAIAVATEFVELGSYPKFNSIFAENTYFKQI